MFMHECTCTVLSIARIMVEFCCVHRLQYCIQVHQPSPSLKCVIGVVLKRLILPTVNVSTSTHLSSLQRTISHSQMCVASYTNGRSNDQSPPLLILTVFCLHLLTPTFTLEAPHSDCFTNDGSEALTRWSNVSSQNSRL